MMSDEIKFEQPESDLLDTLIGRLGEGTAQHLDRRMQEAETIKRQEAEASERRLEKMWVREHERQRRLQAAKSEQQRQEQMLIRLVLVGAAVLMIVIILLAIGMNLAG
jgi:hypothetical protein